MASVRLFLTPKTGFFVLLTGLLISVELAVTHTTGFSRHPVAVSLGVLFDLVVVTSGLFYWLVAKPLRLPRSRTFLVAILMLRLASLMLPEGAFLSNQFWPYLLVLTEAMALTLAGFRIRTIVQTYKRLRPRMDAESACIATVKRPSYMTDTHLHIRFGVRWRATIPRPAIVTVERIQEKPAKQPGQLHGAFLTAPTVLLVFREPIRFQGPYGLTKQVSRLTFCADNPVSFVDQLMNGIG